MAAASFSSAEETAALKQPRVVATNRPLPSSSNSASSSIPEALLSLLDWNPPELELQRHEEGGSPAKASRKPSFYDRHLTEKLILKRLQYHPDLAAEIATTVDAAIEAALEADGGTLPPSDGQLLSDEERDVLTFSINHIMSRELPITQFYKEATARLCLPVASTLALHPKYGRWLSLLHWSVVPNAGGFAISDGSLQILDIDSGDQRTRKFRDQVKASMDPKMVETLRQLRSTYPDLAIWEVKSLTVGHSDVMIGLKKSAEAGRPFHWTSCFCDGNLHSPDKQDAVENTRAGPDAQNAPWRLPGIHDESTQPSYVAESGNNDDSNAGDAGPPPTTLQMTVAESQLPDRQPKRPSRKGKNRAGDADLPFISEGSKAKRKRDESYKTINTLTAESFLQQVNHSCDGTFGILSTKPPCRRGLRQCGLTPR